MIRLLLRMFYLLLFLGALLLTVIWGRRNAQPVTLDYYWGQAEMPLAAVFLGGLIAGALLSMLVSGFTIVALRLQNWRLSRQLARHQAPLPGESSPGVPVAAPPGTAPAPGTAPGGFSGTTTPGGLSGTAAGGLSGTASRTIPGAVPGMAPGAAPAAWRRFAPVPDKES